MICILDQSHIWASVEIYRFVFHGFEKPKKRKPHYPKIMMEQITKKVSENYFIYQVRNSKNLM
jgi:hypothetical protein